CQCVQYSSIPGDREWGQFTSPDYPSSYQRGIRCLLFSFQAPKDHIVQITFQVIKLPQPRNGCHAGDYLKLFLHLEEEGVNERTPWNSLICGDHKNQTFSSASRHLILQFHSSSLSFEELLQKQPHHHQPNLLSLSTPLPTFGFHGKFRFLNASQFESNGRLVPGTKCDYRFVSENFTSPEGKFFSPLHPSLYPHNTMCAYHFTAGLEERVKIVFESVILQPGKSSCLNKTDVIRIFDGSPTTRSPVISVICNEALDYELTSSGRDLFIEFIANSGSPGTGFRARYKFAKIVIDNGFDPLENFKQYFANKGRWF
ncbi:Deleted in malignant brain tumors 1 protein, partial [Orchesella cincta]